MLAMDVWCFSKSTARIDLEKHQTRLHYWGISLCNFGESPLQFWVFLLYTKQFCEIAETKQVERGTNDTCFYDCVSFKVLHFTIYVSDETLGTALHRLSEKQRSAILLRYFQGTNDREISELYRVSRSAIFSRRSRGLRKLKTLLSERK